MLTKKKEEQKEDIQYKKDVIELKEAHKKANLENEKRDLKTHEILNKLDQKINKLEESDIKIIKDLNAYKNIKHDIETEKTALIKTLERSNELNEKNTDLMEKIIKKL